MNAPLLELEVLRDVATRLERGAFDYMLTGSLAMSHYATPRMTRDIDLVVAIAVADLARLRGLFEPDYYVPDGLDRMLAVPGMFNLVHLASVVKVALIVRKDNPFRRAEFDRRRRIDLGGFEVWVASKEDVLLSKLVWARDADSEQQRRDAINLLRSGVDDAYVDGWADRLGVRALLDSLRHA